MCTLLSSTSSVIEVMNDGLQHICLQLELIPWPNKNHFFGFMPGVPDHQGADVDVDAHSIRPGHPEFSRHLEEELGKFMQRRVEALNSWANSEGLTAAQSSEKTDLPVHSDRQQLYLILYIQHMIHNIGLAILDLCQFSDAFVARGTMERNRLIVPSAKRLWKWFLSVFDIAESPSPDDDRPNPKEKRHMLWKATRAIAHDHLAPRNAFERCGGKDQKISRVFERISSRFWLAISLVKEEGRDQVDDADDEEADETSGGRRRKSKKDDQHVLPEHVLSSGQARIFFIMLDKYRGGNPLFHMIHKDYFGDLGTVIQDWFVARSMKGQLPYTVGHPPLNLQSAFVVSMMSWASAHPESAQVRIRYDSSLKETSMVFVVLRKFLLEEALEYTELSPRRQLHMSGAHVHYHWLEPKTMALTTLMVACLPQANTNRSKYVPTRTSTSSHQYEFEIKVRTKDWQSVQNGDQGPLLLLFTPDAIVPASLHDILDGFNGQDGAVGIAEGLVIGPDYTDVLWKLPNPLSSSVSKIRLNDETPAAVDQYFAKVYRGIMDKRGLPYHGIGVEQWGPVLEWLHSKRR